MKPGHTLASTASGCTDEIEALGQAGAMNAYIYTDCGVITVSGVGT